MEHDLGIHDFKPTQACLNVKVHTTRSKFLRPSGYCAMFNYALTFHTINVFGCSHGVMVQFQLVKPLITLHVHLYGFQIIHSVKKCTMYQRTNLDDTTNHLFFTTSITSATWYTRCRLTHSKLLQNFWLIFEWDVLVVSWLKR